MSKDLTNIYKFLSKYVNSQTLLDIIYEYGCGGIEFKMPQKARLPLEKAVDMSESEIRNFFGMSNGLDFKFDGIDSFFDDNNDFVRVIKLEPKQRDN